MNKTIIFLCALFLLVGIVVKAQVVSTTPAFPTENTSLVITFDATEGNAGLAGFSGVVYAHTGVITNLSTSPSDWKYTKGTWGTANAPIMTSVGGDEYTLSISDARTYYGVPSGETIEKIAIIFRNEAGAKSGRNADGSDIFIQLYTGGLYANVTAPSANTIYTKGEIITLEGGSSESADLAIAVNGTTLKNATGTTIAHSYTASVSGNYEVVLSAEKAGQMAYDTIQFVINPALTTASFPANNKLGVNYNSSTSLILGLYAPFKEYVYVLGDFNDWTVNTDYFMKRDADGSTWWLEIPNLKSGERYAFQYYVDGEIKIADPYSELVIDPNNDKFIDAQTYPNPFPYPTGKTTGIATLVETNKTPYAWKVTDFDAPDENELIVYELLVRDFVSTHNYATLMDTLDYLENLGVNAIELMPINEFEGNESWGYNPSFHMALDKYYGTPESFKALVDECHKRRIAVIADVVYNHAFSQNPLCQLYWDQANFKPSSQNPFVNPDATHDFNVGYDLNHESPAFKAYVKQVMEYWLTEYKLDGFRFDLSKGFTQKNTLGDVGAWGQYDGTRVNNIKRIYSEMKAVNPNAYVILEHFADNSEEKDLANHGCMFWGNLNHEATEAAMGYASNFSNAYHKTKGWNNPKNIAFAESHDEERMMYKNLQYGSVVGNYSIKDINTALDRSELTWVVFSAIPGPKMIWQFQELGYDFSIDFNGRVGNKPVKWDYNTASNRKDVYRVMADMNKLKTTYDAFDGGDVGLDLSGKGKRVHLTNADQSFVVLGNFDAVAIDMVADFQHTGMWYEYFRGDSLNITDTKLSMNFGPGAYMVWTDKRIKTSSALLSTRSLTSEILLYPNPVLNTLTMSLDSRNIKQVEILDASGRIVLDENIEEAASLVTIDVQSLSSGLYVARMITSGGILYSKFTK